MTAPLDSRFVFNPRASDNIFIKEMRDRLNQLEQQVEDLRDRVVVGDMRFFDSLLRAIPNDADWKELRVLGRAIVKYAENLTELRQLQDKLKVVDTAKANPDLMALAFSDTSEISEGFEKLLQNEE